MLKFIIINIIICLILLYIYIIITNKNKHSKIEYNNSIIFPQLIDTYFYENNSSIVKENEHYTVYTRISNFSDPSKKIIYNILAFLGLINFVNKLGITVYDKNFNIISQDINNLENDRNLSIEDLLVFLINDKKYFIGSGRRNNKRINIANIMPLGNKYFYPIILDENFKIYDIVDKYGKKLYGNKNLVPIGINYLIINHNPLELLKIEKFDTNNNMCFTSCFYKGTKQKNLPNLRGNTPYIKIDDNKFIGIAHSTEYKLFNSRNYYHYFIVINFNNDNPYIEKISKPICFMGNCGIEFVMGFIESFDRQNFIITLGKNDTSAHVIFLSKKELFANL